MAREAIRRTPLIRTEFAKHGVFVVSQISSAEKIPLGARVGTLSQARVDRIVAGLLFLQRSSFQR